MATPNPSGEGGASGGRGAGRGAGAWAAAAVVVAVGALGFAVAAHQRADDLEARVDRLEAPASTAEPPSSQPSTSPPTSRPPDAVVSSTAASTTVPVDGSAARQGVEAAFRRAYDGASGAAERLAAIDDPTGVEVALQHLFTGAYSADAALSNAVVEAVELTSDTRARVEYTFTLGTAPPSRLSGEARVVSGEWKVTRATVCRDLRAFGAACG